MARLPSAESATDEPCADFPTAPLPTSLPPCCVHTPLVRVKTHTAPAPLLSLPPPMTGASPSSLWRTPRRPPMPRTMWTVGSRLMGVKLKRLFWARSKLADGTYKDYWYAWKGGPRLLGEPGTPEFIASYNAAVAAKIAAPEGRLLRLLQDYQRSQDFLGLRDRTRSDYIGHIKKIEIRFGDMPTKALADQRARGVFMDWRDELALKSPRQADYTWTVLAAVLAWAKDRGKIPTNPCEKGGRVYHGTRVDHVWSIEHEERFLRLAPPHLHLALLLALWTGQRQGDLLRLPWSAYDGSAIRLRQSKSVRKGARRPVSVTIPVGAPLKEALDTAMLTRRSTIILTTIDGTPWTLDGFRASWGKACAKAGVVGVTFNDLRGTAVTRLALVGCTEAEIATITGHSLRDVRSILDAHYLHRDPELAKARHSQARTGVRETRQGG
jgi:integrase